MHHTADLIKSFWTNSARSLDSKSRALVAGALDAILEYWRDEKE